MARALINRPTCCWPTNRPATSTPPAPATSWPCSRRARRAGQTIVLVTHDARVAARADRVITMRDGRSPPRRGSTRASARRHRQPPDAAGGVSDGRRRRARAGRPALAGPARPACPGCIVAAAAALHVTLALRAGPDEPFAARRQRPGAPTSRARGALEATPTSRADPPARRRGRRVRPAAFGTTVLPAGTVDVRLEGAPAATRPWTFPASPRPPPARRRRGAARAQLRARVRAALGQTLKIDPAPRAGRHTAHHRPRRHHPQADFPRWSPGLAWAPDAAVAQLGGARTGTRIGVRLADPEASSDYIRAIEPGLQDVGFADWHDVRDTITDQARTNTIIIGVNTLLALIAVGFTVATVIGGRVLAQRRDRAAQGDRDHAARRRRPAGRRVRRARARGRDPRPDRGHRVAPLLLKPMSSLLATPTPSAFQPGDAADGARADRRRRRALRALPARRAGRLITVEALALGSAARPAAPRGPPRRPRPAPPRRPPASAPRAPSPSARALLTTGALVLLIIPLVAALRGRRPTTGWSRTPPCAPSPMRCASMPAEGACGSWPSPSATTCGRATTYDEERAGGSRATRRVRGPGSGSLGDQPQAFRYAVPDGPRDRKRPGEAVVGRGLFDALGA